MLPGCQCGSCLIFPPTECDLRMCQQVDRQIDRVSEQQIPNIAIKRRKMVPSFFFPFFSPPFLYHFRKPFLSRFLFHGRFLFVFIFFLLFFLSYFLFRFRFLFLFLILFPFFPTYETTRGKNILFAFSIQFSVFIFVLFYFSFIIQR